MDTVLEEILNSHLLKNVIPNKPLEGFALVLGGGGAKGSYEAGVMKALVDMGIKINGVYGTSVGALNGAFFVNHKIDQMLSLWLNLKLTDVFDIPLEFIKNGEIKITKANILRFLKFQKLLLKDKGFDNSPLKELLKKNLEETKIRESPIHFGLITFNLTKFKPEEIYIEQIPEGTLLDFLLASANFPIFQHTRFNNASYTDGGVYDNLPFQLALDKGFKRLILIDVKGIGRTRKIAYENLNLIYIRAKHNTGTTLNFSSAKIKENIIRGYLDTFSLFHCIEESHLYYFTYSDQDKKIDSFLSLFKEQLNKFLSHINYKEEIINLNSNKNTLICKILGLTASYLKLNSLKLYNMHDMIWECANHYHQFINNTMFKNTDINHIFKNFSDELNSAKMWLLLSYFLSIEKTERPNKKIINFLNQFTFFKKIIVMFFGMKTAYLLNKNNLEKKE